jgi:TFIIF-interacting CTD phosphatase-like protein
VTKAEVSVLFSIYHFLLVDILQGLTQKSLQRLFPVDTSMVVIIDDRADVWEWSPNLVKVIPC